MISTTWILGIGIVAILQFLVARDYIIICILLYLTDIIF